MKVAQPQVMIPADVAQILAPEAEKLGINLAGVVRMAPTIDVTRNIRELALDLGRSLARYNIFLKVDDIVTVDATTGEVKSMTAKRLPDWAESNSIVFIAPGARRVRSSLSVDDAAQILETDTFRGCLRPLTAVHTMILPVIRRREGEEPSVEFLEPGYDEESGIYTLELISYDAEWKLGRAQQFGLSVHPDFPWNRGEGEAAPKDEQHRWLFQNRSFSVHLMAMVGRYCRAMFEPGSLFPIIAYFANKPGTGKTRLAEMVVTAVHGYAASMGAPKDDEKMEVKLETVAQSMAPYVIFDDIGGGLRSNPLNRFTTESWHMGRKFHSNKETFEVPNVTQVFVTANDLPTSEDIDRRALIVELFLDTEVKGRKFPRVITPQWLALPETRGEFLSFCCALVKNWIAKGMPRHSAPLETYEEWTSVVAGIVQAAEFADPLQQREGVVGGSMDEDELKELLVQAASLQPRGTKEVVITRGHLVFVARKHGLCENLVGTDGDMDPAATKRFGRKMQRWRGQKLRDNYGRLFQFSHKKKKSGATYPLAFINAAEDVGPEKKSGEDLDLED